MRVFDRFRKRKVGKEVATEAEFGARSLTGILRIFTGTVAIAMSFYHLYTAGVGIPTASIHRSVHLCFGLALCFFLFPGTRRGRRDTIPILDWILAVCGAAAAIYVAVFYREIVFRVGNPTSLDLVFGAALILLVLEATRRSVSPALPFITVLFIIYTFVGPYMPDIIAHRGYSLRRFIDHEFLTMEGLWGVPIGVSATFVFLFVLFGAFLDRIGAGEFLINLSFATMGRFRGGPAKAAVVASAAMGTVSGSSIANTVTTGAMTIPLMKKVGFRSEIAGAVEVAASTNGQLMPPVMGAAAFIMAEFTDIPYIQIVKHAFIPAVLSYVAIFSIIHLEAIKSGIQRLPKEDTPDLLQTLMKGSHYLIPLAVLIYVLLITRLTPLTSAFVSICVGIVISLIDNFVRTYLRRSEWEKPITDQRLLIQRRPVADTFGGSFWMWVRIILQAMEMGARNMVGIAAACACCGIIVGVVTLTGLGLKMTAVIISIGQVVDIPVVQVLLTLLFAVFACIILGMGLPTTATYIIMAAMTAPAIVELGKTVDVGGQLGVPLIAAHLFVFYYGIVADDTPPVGLCAYAAAGIAHSDPIKTGFNSFRLDAAAFTLPFIYFFNPQLLLINVTPLGLPMIIGTAILGMFAFSAGIQGFFIIRAKIWERMSFFVIAILLIWPGLWTDMVGLGGMSLIYLLQRGRRSRLQVAAGPIG
jgi:TRAP transporter 4TM/12TM fusion protein